MSTNITTRTVIKLSMPHNTMAKICTHHHIICFNVCLCLRSFSESSVFRGKLAQPRAWGSDPKYWELSKKTDRLENSWQSLEAAAPNQVRMPWAQRSHSGTAGGLLDPINTVGTGKCFCRDGLQLYRLLSRWFWRTFAN